MSYPSGDTNLFEIVLQIKLLNFAFIGFYEIIWFCLD